jgi:hypothetical protein
MNRIEIIATFSALQKLHKLKGWEEIGEVIDEVLEEARKEPGYCLSMVRKGEFL